MFKAVEGAECSYGVVPIENSTAGAVRETTEALRSTVLAVRGMTKLRISHALLASRGMDVANVKRIYSHEQVRVPQIRARMQRADMKMRRGWRSARDT